MVESVAVPTQAAGVTGKTAVVDPDVTVTETGTVTAMFALARLTVMSVAAGLDKVTSAVPAGPPPTRALGVIVNAETCGPEVACGVPITSKSATTVHTFPLTSLSARKRMYLPG